MRTIDVDFNDLARDGKVRVWRDEIAGLPVHSIVVLEDEDEAMSRLAELVEVDGDRAYFEIMNGVAQLQLDYGVGYWMNSIAVRGSSCNFGTSEAFKVTGHREYMPHTLGVRGVAVPA